LLDINPLYYCYKQADIISYDFDRVETIDFLIQNMLKITYAVKEN